MRKLFHLCIIFVAACIASWVHSAKPQLPDLLPTKPKLDQAKLDMLAKAKPSRAFVLATELKTALEFPIEGQQGDVRLVSTANLAGSARIASARVQHLANPSKRWEYALNVEVLDEAGKVLLQKDYHQRANLLELRRADGNLSASAFYLQTDLIPLSNDVTSLNLSEYPQAKRLRVRLAQQDSNLADVVLRVYQARPESAQAGAHRWQRLSKQQQEELARGSVHGKNLLDAQERQNLLRNSRIALGPLGNEGHDYQVRDLYVLFENEGEIRAAPIAPYGVAFGQQVFGMIPVPPSGGKVRLEFQPAPSLDGSKATPVPAEIQLRWYGTGLFQKTSSSLAWDGNNSSHQIELAGGLLEIAAPQAGHQAVIVRAFFSANNNGNSAEIEITPVPQYERVFIASRDLAVSYALGAVEGQSGLRLTLRSLQAGNLRATKANYEAFDARGQSLGRGQVAVPANSGHYERITLDYSAQEAKLNNNATAPNQLSDAASAFFLLPAKTSRLTVWADNSELPLLVVAHSRPFALARELRLPEDNYSYDAQGKRIPAWFLLHPENEEQMVANQRSRQIVLQARPLLETSEQEKILQGAYQWQDFRPQGAWLARPIYAPIEPNTPYREEALPTSFTPVASNTPVKLDFPPYQGLNTVQATLVWQGKKETRTLQLLLDGQPWVNLPVQAAYAEMVLPPLRLGTHTLQIKGAQGGQVYLNHLKPTSASLQRRIAQRFQQELVFDFERTSASAETLSARLFQLGDGEKPPQVSIRISGPQAPSLTPLSGWLFTDRIATVQANAKRSKVFDTEGLIADGGSPIYLPFPPDAPLGRYQIRLQLQSGTGKQHYLALSRLTSVLSNQRRLHHQPEIAHVTLTE